MDRELVKIPNNGAPSYVASHATTSTRRGPRSVTFDTSKSSKKSHKSSKRPHRSSSRQSGGDDDARSDHSSSSYTSSNLSSGSRGSQAHQYQTTADLRRPQSLAASDISRSSGFSRLSDISGSSGFSGSSGHSDVTVKPAKPRGTKILNSDNYSDVTTSSTNSHSSNRHRDDDTRSGLSGYTNDSTSSSRYDDGNGAVVLRRGPRSTSGSVFSNSSARPSGSGASEVTSSSYRTHHGDDKVVKRELERVRLALEKSGIRDVIPDLKRKGNSVTVESNTKTYTETNTKTTYNFNKG
jgi:hypothetical protein